jgi:diacylglycerol kinase (ATP)
MDSKRSRFRARSFPESMNYATAGLAYAFRTQRNLRLHFSMAVLVILLAAAFRFTRLELSLLSLTIGMVITSELVNTAVEATVDLITGDYHPLAAIAKNLAAAAVLMASVVAVAVGFFLFFERLAGLHQEALARTLATPPYVSFLGLVLVLSVVLALKVSNTPVRLQGGMPSAHTAAATSLATSVFFVSGNGVSTLLALAMAVLVGQSRVEARIHSVVEVVAGGLIGILLTALAFQLIP